MMMKLDDLTWEVRCCGEHRTARQTTDDGELIVVRQMGEDFYYLAAYRNDDYNADSERVPGGQAQMDRAGAEAALA